MNKRATCRPFKFLTSPHLSERTKIFNTVRITPSIQQSSSVKDILFEKSLKSRGKNQRHVRYKQHRNLIQALH